MKLKTMMARECDECFPISTDELTDAKDIEHDAMVAHALFLAMDQWGTDEFGVVDALRSRAEELLQQWGYEE